MALDLSSNRGIVKKEPGKAIITDVSIPPLRPGYILVRTHSVALNPADWMDIDSPDYSGCISGLDYSGVVVNIGDGTTKGFKPGDRIAGASHGCDIFHPGDGAFAQYIIVKADVQIHIPDSMSFEDASSLGVGVLTAGMALFHLMGLPQPTELSDALSGADNHNPWILIYGGSSATGSMAIQLAKLAGFRVVTTCSPHNFGFAEKLGADAVFDYHDPKVSNLISEATSDSLVYAFDTIATDVTASICVSAFTSKAQQHAIRSTGKAIYACTLDPTLPSSAPLPVEKLFVVGYSGFGEDAYFEGMDLPASKEDYDFTVGFMGLVEKLLQKGKLKNHPVSVNRQGTDFEGIMQGINLLREGKVSGTKLVYNIQQRPE